MQSQVSQAKIITITGLCHYAEQRKLPKKNLKLHLHTKHTKRGLQGITVVGIIRNLSNYQKYGNLTTERIIFD